MIATVAQIYRYPVKGMTPELLTQVPMTPGEGLPNDRRYALHVGNNPFDPIAPQWMAKTNFLMLMRDERLAKLRTRFDDATGILTVDRDGKTVVRGNLADAAGRMVLEQFFAAFMGGDIRRHPRVVEAPGHMFSDVAAKVISVIGLASVADLERVLRGRVDPLRFRANVYVEGLGAWGEFDLVGKQVRLGSATLEILKRIDRCAATDVDPSTGIRDLRTVALLEQHFGHNDCGVYARVVSGGDIKKGDLLTAL